jgi:hypothetical protein
MAVEMADRPLATTTETALETSGYKKRNYFPWISWGAIFGGLASGLATFILLALLGLAAGFTAVDPQEAEPVGRAPLITGIWTGISMLISAFVGGYIAARISGFSRKGDGMLHGFVVWGVNTVFFVYLVTTSVGSLLGGTFNVLGQGIKATAGAVGQAAGGAAASPETRDQLESLITGSAGGATITQESMERLRQSLSAGDRQGAVNIMVNEMGFAPDRAEATVDQAMTMQGAIQQLPPAEEVAEKAVTGLTAASWTLFVAMLLSLALSIFGGAAGSRGVVKRRSPLAHA